MSGEKIKLVKVEEVERVQCSTSPELEETLKHLFTQLYASRDQNFGNAGLVENIFNEMDDLRSYLIVERNLDRMQEPFQVADIPPRYRDLAQQDRENQANLDQLLHELDDLVGLHPLDDNS